MPKIKIKKFLYIFLLLELFFSYTPVYAQQASGFDYRQSGVQAQIEKYLCAPNVVPESQTNVGNGALLGGDPTLPGTFQNNAAFNNNNNGILFKCINQIYKFAIVIAAVVGVFFIVIAGYLYMSSDGDAEAVSKAKDILRTSIASIVILFGGYILLKAINPDLIQFHSIQPPSIDMTQIKDMAEPKTDSNGTIPPEGLVTTPLTGRGNGSVSDLEAAGCSITAESRVRNELPNLSAPMWSKLQQICKTVSASGLKPMVSSTVRRESKGSYHQNGCAVDFADGVGDGFFDFNTKKGRPVGIAIYNAALQAGISIDQINPGVDRQGQTYHLHIDLGSSCPNKLGTVPN